VRRLPYFGRSRPMRGMGAMKPMASIPTLDDQAADEDKKLAGWIERVGDARAQAAAAVFRERTGSTTLPELLTEIALRSLGADYRTQVDLGWARPDFVVFDGGEAIIVRVQGDYWHTRAGAEANDAAQRDRLERHTVFGYPIREVVDVWEREIYESEAVIARLLRAPGVRADGGVTVTRRSFADLVLATPDLWGFWRFADESPTVARDEMGRDPGTYEAGAAVPDAFGPGRSVNKRARSTSTGSGIVRVSAGLAVTDYTVEAWTMLETNVYSGTLTTIGTGGNQSRVNIFSAAAGWNVRLNSTQLGPISGNGVWHHLAVVLASGATEARLYWNGARIATKAVTAIATSANYLMLGGDGSGRQWLDDLALYTRSLSDEEIAAHYAAG
jgi:hypothetical protein